MSNEAIRKEFQVLVETIESCFKALQSQALRFEKLLAESSAPIRLPGLGKEDHVLARELVAKDFCALWFESTGEEATAAASPLDANFERTSGLIVADKQLAEEAEKLNAAKTAFEKSIGALKAKLKEVDKLKIYHMDHLQAGLEKRDPKLSTALRELGIARLDLIACYRLIKILPSTLRSISWTWARSHAAIREMKYKQVTELIEKELDNEAREMCLKTVSALPESTLFARKKTKTHPQLRANLTYLDGTPRHQITISRVCLVRDRSPDIVEWATPLNLMQKRVKRTDAVIDKFPLFEDGLLNIFLYIGEGKASKKRRLKDAVKEEQNGSNE